MMGAEVSYELNLEPVEDGPGWTAMIYRSVRAGVCGPWTETKTVLDGDERMLFWQLPELVRRALLVVDPAVNFRAGVPEVYGRYGKVAVRVPLTWVDRPQQMPQVGEDGRVEWVTA
jgi:hypothetical protein